MKKVLMTGIKNQDGYFLGEFLINKNYEFQFKFFLSKPEGALFKKINSKCLNYTRWQHEESLHQELVRTIESSLNNL